MQYPNEVTPGTYKVSVSNENGTSNSLIFTVTGTTSLQPSITVLSPNGGEKLIRGSLAVITANIANLTSKTISIDLLRGGKGFHVYERYPLQKTPTGYQVGGDIYLKKEQ